MVNYMIFSNKFSIKFKWYVINIKAGLEKEVKYSLLERICRLNLQEYFGNILIPLEKIENFKNGNCIVKRKKYFPGYILVQLHFNKDTWHLIQNTPKISGFMGNKKKPTSLSDEEVERIYIMIKNSKKTKKILLYKIGNRIRIINGPFINFNGIIEEIKLEKEKMKVMVSIFGRLTPVELDFSQVKKIE